MNARRCLLGALLLLASIPASGASANLSVEIGTDRGHDAVYQTGDPLLIKARVSDDAHLMVYEIDAEGYVHLLFPDRDTPPLVEGERSYELPASDSNLELVVRGPVGQGYIVAIASYIPFADLPWYLRPYDAQAEEMGYEGEPDEEEGVTAEGRIVGDPFVAMERIRRRVLVDPDTEQMFATAYTTYYVGHEVKYPRYLCNDCHRPGYYSWWAGFDPYYQHCSVFNFRVNWAWTWGSPYWTGFVPHYVYTYRPDCPPHYRLYGSQGVRHSSWDGWRRWKTLWGGPLRRYKDDPVPRTAYDPNRRWPKDATPPGFMTGGGRRLRGGVAPDPVAQVGGKDRGGRQAREVREGVRRLTQGGRPARTPRYAPRDPQRRVGDVIGRQPRNGEPGRRQPRANDLGRRERRADPGQVRDPRQTRDGTREPRQARDGARERGDRGERRETRQGREERRHFRSFDPTPLMPAPKVEPPSYQGSVEPPSYQRASGGWSGFDTPRVSDPAPVEPSVQTGRQGWRPSAPEPRQAPQVHEVPQAPAPQRQYRPEPPAAHAPPPAAQPHVQPPVRADPRVGVFRASPDPGHRVERSRRQ